MKIRLPISLKEALAGYAQKEGVSMNQMIVKIIDEYLEEKASFLHLAESIRDNKLRLSVLEIRMKSLIAEYSSINMIMDYIIRDSAEIIKNSSGEYEEYTDLIRNSLLMRGRQYENEKKRLEESIEKTRNEILSIKIDTNDENDTV